MTLKWLSRFQLPTLKIFLEELELNFGFKILGKNKLLIGEMLSPMNLLLLLLQVLLLLRLSLLGELNLNQHTQTLELVFILVFIVTKQAIGQTILLLLMVVSLVCA